MHQVFRALTRLSVAMSLCAVAANAFADGYQITQIPAGVFDNPYDLDFGSAQVPNGLVHGLDAAVLRTWSAEQGARDVATLPFGVYALVNDVGSVVRVDRRDLRSTARLTTADGRDTRLDTHDNFVNIQRMNNQNQMVGSDGYSAVMWLPDGSRVDVGPQGVPLSYGTGINSAGVSVGTYQSGPNAYRAFVTLGAQGWTDLGELPLGTSPASMGAAAINVRNQVVGGVRNDDLLTAFVWDPVRGMQSIAPTSSRYYGRSSAWGISDTGVVLGQHFSDVAQVDIDESFIWTEQAGIVALKDLLSPELQATYTNIIGTSINGSGEIIAWATLHNQAVVSLVLTPVPEPAAVALWFVGGLAGLVIRQRRRGVPSLLAPH